MSTIRVLVGTKKGAFILTSDAQRRNWNVSGPLFSGWEVYHVKGSPADPDRIYASQTSGWFGQIIQRSGDGGRTWEQPGTPPGEPTTTPEGFPKGESNKFVYDTSPQTGKPLTTHQHFDGTQRPWEFKRVWHLEPSASDPDTVFAGVEDAAMFRTTDGGKTWHELAGLRGHGTGPKWQPGAGGMGLHTIILSPSPTNGAQPPPAVNVAQPPSAVNVAQPPPAVNVAQPPSAVNGAQPPSAVNVVHPPSAVNGAQPPSAVNGAHPPSAVNGAQTPSAVSAARRDGGRIFAAISAAGVFRSDDGGKTWSPKNRGLSSQYLPEPAPEIGFCVHRIAMHPARPDTLFMQLHWHVCRSDDGGDTWRKVSGNLPSDFGFPIAVHAHEPETIYVVPILSDSLHYPPEGKLRVYRSRVGGNEWQALTNGLPQKDCYVNILRGAMSVDSLDPCGIYFGTTGGQVYASADAGDSWFPIVRDLPAVLSVEVQTLP